MTTEEAGRPDIDYSPFRTMTERHTTGEPGGKLAQWHERTCVVRKTFPSVYALDWTKLIIEEPEVIGAVLKDVLKAMQAPPGKPGPRPNLNHDEAQPVVDRWFGRDPKERPYATVPFPQAFRILARGYSIRHVARKLNMSKTRVFSLMAGQTDPTPETMAQIAETFGKRPSFFVEYRVGWAVSVFAGAMEAAPEETIRVYETLQRAVS